MPAAKGSARTPLGTKLWDADIGVGICDSGYGIRNMGYGMELFSYE